MDIIVVLLTILTFTGNIFGATVNYQVDEGVRQGDILGYLFRDSDLSQRYHYKILLDLRLELIGQKPSTGQLLVKLDSYNGILTAATNIDRDVLCPKKIKCQLELDVSVSPIQYFEIFKVIIDLIDINDNSPEFTESTVTKYISEATLAGSEFALPLASDKDSLSYSVKQYKLQEKTSMFALKTLERDGEIFSLKLELNEMLDRETVDFYQLHVVALDGGDPSRSAVLTVNVIVLDINDHRPAFHQPVYEVPVSENIAPHTTFLTATATDQDLDKNSMITYGISERGIRSDLFAINEQTGAIYTTGYLDRETQNYHKLYITAKDGGPEALTDQTLVIVRLLDENDEKPKVEVHGLQGVLETTPVGSMVAHISVTDQDSGQNGQFKCFSEDHEYFILEHLNGGEFKLILKQELDFELAEVHKVIIKCHDFGANSKETVEEIEIKVTDNNDNIPVFEEEKYVIQVPENNTSGSFITQLRAKDRDQGYNGEIHYTLSDQAQSTFSIDPQSGIITANSALDYEQIKSVEMMVFATDKGEPPLSSSATVVINLLDIDDEIPTFTQPSYEFAICPPLVAQTVVGVVAATDKDDAPFDRFLYKLQGSQLFDVDSETGEIFSNEDVSGEEFYSFTVTAESNTGNSHSSTAQVTVTFSYTASMTDSEERQNLVIIASITAVALLFICLLVAGIIMVTLRNKRKPKTRVNKKDTECGNPFVQQQLCNNLSSEKLETSDEIHQQESEYTDDSKDDTREDRSTDSGKGASDDGDSSKRTIQNNMDNDYISIQISPDVHTNKKCNAYCNPFTKTSTPIGSVDNMLDKDQHKINIDDETESTLCDNMPKVQFARNPIYKSFRTFNSQKNCDNSSRYYKYALPQVVHKSSSNVIPVYPKEQKRTSTPNFGNRHQSIHFYKITDISDNYSDEEGSTTSGSYVIDDADHVTGINKEQFKDRIMHVIL